MIRASRDLIGRPLDWAVHYVVLLQEGRSTSVAQRVALERVSSGHWPSESWAEGGPLLNEVVITPAARRRDDGAWKITCWQSQTFDDHLNDADDDSTWFEGGTQLIAGLRCFVTKALGSTVDVPDDLLSGPGEYEDLLLHYIGAMSADDATGEVLGFRRAYGGLGMEPIDFAGSAMPLAKASNYELIVFDGGNKHGDSWKAIFHPPTRSHLFVREAA